MTITSMRQFRHALATFLVAFQAWAPPMNQARAAAVPIADAPLLATSVVPPNLLLTLSVEWPTGVVAAYNDNLSTATGFTCPGRSSTYGICYFDDREYLGYFDSKVCYLYDNTNEYFYRSSAATGTNLHQCSGKFSGNYLNWATMHAMDEFRFTMTGGDRVTDTATETVIEKTFHNGQGGYGQFPIKRVRTTADGVVPAVTPSTVSPFTYTNLYARVHNNGAAVSKSGVANSLGRVVQFSDASNFSTNLTTYLVRVKVCDGTAGYETNCVQYGSSWKPNGLIQDNADRMRFGVVSYLNDSTAARSGGVLRSAMKFVGQNNVIPNSLPAINANPEINTDGTFVANPDPTEATASGVANSGVINYLNKFGKTSESYKSRDTLSEMVYEGTRYMRNLSESTQYTAGMTTVMKDGFPVITNWTSKDQSIATNRAIQYSCQKSFFVGIADSNTHCDVTIPGNSLTPSTGDNTHCSTHPATYSGTDSQVNITTLDNAVGAMENAAPNTPGAAVTKYGTANLGTKFADYGLTQNDLTTTYRRYNTFHAAGLAYWMNSSDILPDDASKAWTLGNQTAQSYWVDVRETGTSENPPGNQLWLASKYGGYNNTGTAGALKTAPTAVADFDENGDGTPDNYFTAERPDLLNRSLKLVFQDVLDKTYSGAGASISTQSLTSGGSSYEVRYSSANWTGDVKGNTLTLSTDNPVTTTVDEGGVPTETNVWSAQAKLAALAGGTGWDTARRIVSYNGTVGVPFRLSNAGANLTATQLGYLGADATARGKLIDYVRGKRTDEGSTFRVRTALLGDIVDSEATFVGAPSEPYADGFNPGFTAFKATAAVASRTQMIYVGANDGMLHAFNASTSVSDGGNEKWAYIPSFVLSGPSSPATPQTDGLAARAALGNFSHKYYVNQTPTVRSVDFARTGTAPTGGFATSLTPNWRTLLVAGMNKGGRGYFAVDVTDPAAATASELAAAGKVLWEFTDADMGLTFGRPIVAKTRKYGWVVIMSSGHNNTLGGVAANRGKGYLYIVNAQTGALLEKISTNEGDATTPSGFAPITGFVQDFKDMTVDEIYGGDLLGNLWRFDLTTAAGSASAYPAPTKIATLQDSSGTAQPITTEPKIEIDKNRIDRWVFVGTGNMLASSDVSSTAVQTFYAIRDGSVTVPYTSSTLPGTVTFPSGRASMVALTNPVAGITKDNTKPMGWYHDLTTHSGGAAERVINAPSANEGFIAWIGQKPSTDPCSPAISSYVYLVDYSTGKSYLTDTSGASIASYAVPIADAYALKVVFVKDGTGRMRIVISTGQGALRGVSSSLTSATGIPLRLNWREVLQ